RRSGPRVRPIAERRALHGGPTMERSPGSLPRGEPMSIFGRLNQVIKSNLNSLVDQAEDPEKLIGQTVIDMEAELKKARREIVTTLGTSKRLDKRALELDAEAAGWEEKAVLALRAGDEPLAREALLRKARATAEAGRVRGQAAQQAT